MVQFSVTCVMDKKHTCDAKAKVTMYINAIARVNAWCSCSL